MNLRKNIEGDKIKRDFKNTMDLVDLLLEEKKEKEKYFKEPEKYAKVIKKSKGNFKKSKGSSFWFDC